MKSSCLLASLVLLGLNLAACGSGYMPDPGSRTEDAPVVDLDTLRITVSGRAELLPEAAQMLADQGQPPPSLVGLPIVIEEPLRVGVSDADSTFGSGKLNENQHFSIPDVAVKDIHLSLAASVDQEGFARTSTIVFDTAFTGTRPRTDVIDTQVWVLPMAFHDALTRAVGDGLLRTLTDDRAQTLQGAGYVLGRVVDDKGQPVAGARVQLDQRDLANRLYYPSEDLSQVGQEGTSSNGLFLYIHSGWDAETFHVSIQGKEDYVSRNAGAMAGHGLVLTLFPGTRAP